MAALKESQKVNNYLGVSVGRVKGVLKKTKKNYFFYEDGKEIHTVNEKLVYMVDPKIFKLIGVYNDDISTDDLRSDLLWYIENVMEARQ